MTREQVDKAWLDVARMAGRQDRDTEVHKLRADNERLTRENWQLKGALGYEVPGNIPPGPFICGLCDAKTIEVNETRAEIEQLREHVEALQLVATSHEPEAVRLQADNEQLRAFISELTADCPICHGLGCPPIGCCGRAALEQKP